ncbi:hypothetical protein M513_07102 [Trichuris suis]|uniref:Uncharacterized protein n=1 Tax=Trichuris suis TaxID=68888 RepID=A0A085M424_9BILA|nr:hypothetical protein M513_07102 [Trichuris suis]
MSNIAVYCGRNSERLVNVVLESEGNVPLALKFVNSSNCAHICVVFLERGVMEPIELERAFIEAKSEKHIEIKGITPAEIRSEDLQKLRIAYIPLQNKSEEKETDDQNILPRPGGKYQVSKFITPIPETYRLIGREEFPMSMLRIEDGCSSQQSLLINRCPRSSALTDIQSKWTLGFHSTSVDLPADHTKLEKQKSENQTKANEHYVLKKNELDAPVVKSHNTMEPCGLAKRNNASLCPAHRRCADKMSNVIGNRRDMVGEVSNYMWSLSINVAILLLCYLVIKQNFIPLLRVVMSNIAVSCSGNSERLVNVVLESEGNGSLALKFVNSSNCAQICVVLLDRGVIEPIELEQTIVEAKSEKHIVIKGITPRNEDLEKIRVAYIPLQNKSEKKETDDQNIPTRYGGNHQVSKLIAPIRENYRPVGREEFPMSMLLTEDGYNSQQSLLRNRSPRSFTLTDIQSKWTLGFHSTSVDLPDPSTPYNTVVDEEADHMKLEKQKSENQTITNGCHVLKKSELDVPIKSHNTMEPCGLAKRNNASLCPAHRRCADNTSNVVGSPRDTAGDFSYYAWSVSISVAIWLLCYLVIKAFTF